MLEHALSRVQDKGESNKHAWKWWCTRMAAKRPKVIPEREKRLWSTDGIEFPNDYESQTICIVLRGPAGHHKDSKGREWSCITKAMSDEQLVKTELMNMI